MRTKILFLAGAAFLLSPMASAQQTSGQTPSAKTVASEKRIEKLEKEMKAVQRKVFPGTEGGFFEPEIQPETTKTQNGTATPAITDLTARVDALEAQLATLTNQSEQNAFRLKSLETAFANYKAEQKAEQAAAKTAAQSTDATPVVSTQAVPKTASTLPAATTPKPVTPTKPAATPKPATPKATPAKVETDTPISTSPKRLAAVKAVAIPNTGNAAEDAYMYGYNLWSAKLYPEAQAQLRKVVDTYPSNKRASFAQNLLGRAYMDEGKPNLAITAFFRNFKDRPRGERAPDSLYFMGKTLISMGKNDDACTTFAELEKSYGTTLNATLRRDTNAAKLQAKCSA